MTRFPLIRLAGICLILLVVFAASTVLAQEPTATPILTFDTPTPPPEEVQPSPVTAPTITPVLVQPINVTPTVVGGAAPQGTTPLLAQEYPLAAMGIANLELNSPLGSAQFSFEKPNNWVTDGITVLNLDVEYFENLPSALEEEQTTSGERLTSVLDVTVDGILVHSLNLDRRSPPTQTVPIVIPNSILAASPGGRHDVALVLRAQDHCLAGAQSRVLVRSDLSFLHLEYRERPPLLDLSEYPAALYNGTLGTAPENILFVLPDNPDRTTLQAAASVAAGLGNLTFNDLSIQVRQYSELTDIDRQSFPLVAIGLPGQNRLIDEYYTDGVLPTSRNETGRIVYNGSTVNRDDGVVQLALNPDNTLLPILVVTGFTEEALLKAGQSLAGPPPAIGIQGPVALIEEARTIVRAPTGLLGATEVTLRDLGLDQVTLTGVGAQRFDIELQFPYDQVVTSGAYFDLIYNFSTAFDRTQSSVSIWINDETPITSFYLNDSSVQAASPAGPYSLRVQIPDNSFTSQTQNQLTLFLNMESAEACNSPDPQAAWFTISADSTLYLPRRPVDLAVLNPAVGWFPTPFNSLPDLSNVWISIPENPTSDDIQQLLHVLSQLGSNTTNGEGFNPHIETGSNLPPDSDLGAYHFIVLGRYTTNPFLAMLNPNLPQPFREGTDQLEQVLDDVSYRLPEGYEVGVLEMIRSPWASDKAVLVITGTGPTGQRDASLILSEQTFGRDQLVGDVIFVNGVTTTAIDTTELDERVELLTAIPDLATEAVIEQSTPTEAPPRFTVTPGPTLTPSVTRTPQNTDTPTPVFTFTPSATVPTPIPTFPPLGQDEFQPVAVETPPWVNILVIVTIGATVIGGLFALIQFARSSRNR